MAATETRFERLQMEERRRAEIEKGQRIFAHVAIMQRFDPTYRPNSGITPEERARRDAYRWQHLREGKPHQ